MANEKLVRELKKGADAWYKIYRDITNHKDNLDLRGAMLDGAQLSGVNLCEADLRGAFLRGAMLDNAYFIRTNLSGADLRSTDLRHASFRESDLTNADLREADLLGADLTDADVHQAKYSAGTRWPLNYAPAAYGAKLFKSHYSQTGLEIIFSPELSTSQIKSSLEILADYFRACGGVGFVPDFEFEEITQRENMHV